MYKVASIEAARREIARIQKGRVAKTVDFQGIALKIDRPAGFVQKGKDDAGNAWERTYKTDYGYVPKTQGGDGDGLDVYVGPKAESGLAHWVVQRKADGSFDEFKIMLGFDGRVSARAMWEAHTPKRFYGGMETMSVAMMKALLGLDPQPLFKSEAVRELAFTTLLKAAQTDPMPLVALAQQWAGDRGLLETSAGASVGAAVLRAAESLSKAAGPSGGIVGRALFVFLCDAWDGARAMADDGEVGRATAPILKAFGAIGGQRAAATTGADSRIAKGASHEAISSALCAALRERYPAPEGQEHVYDATPYIREVFDDAVVFSHEGKLHRFGYAFDGVTAVLVGEPELVQVSYVPVEIAKGATERRVRILKAAAEPAVASTEERTALGIVLEPDATDSQGHTYDVATVRRAAHRYLDHFRNVGLQHQQLVNGRVSVVESYLAPADMTIGDVLVKAGTWLMTMRFNDEALWTDVKAGKFTGFSIGGKGVEEPVA